MPPNKKQENKETANASNIATLHLASPASKDASWAKKIYKLLDSSASYAWSAPDGYTYDLIRAYGAGKQPMAQYRNQYSPQGAQSSTAGAQNNAWAGNERLGSQNWNIRSPLPKMKRDIVALILKVALEIEANAIDKLAVDNRNKAELKLKVKAAADRALAEISLAINPQAPPMESGFDKDVLAQPDDAGAGVGFDFTNETERQIAMNLFYRQDVELGAELTIATLFALSEMEAWRTELCSDAFDFGRCAGQRFLNNNTGLPDFRQLDLNRLSIGPHVRRDARDAPGWIYREWFTVNDIVEKMGDCFSRDELKDLYEHGIKTYGYGGLTGPGTLDKYPWNKSTPIDWENVRVQACYFEIKSQNAKTKEVKPVKYGTKYIKRDFNYEPKEGSAKRNTWKQVVYKGYYFPAIDEVKDWGLLSTMTRDLGSPRLTRFSLAYYRFDDKSAVERAIVHLDAIQLLHLKLQTNIEKSLPPGLSFNVDALAGLVLGQAGEITPESVQKLYYQTGSMFHRTLDENGQPIMANSNAPHQILPNGLSPEVMRYVELINNEKADLAESIGWNPLIGGTPPDPRVSAQGTAIAAQNSLNSTHYLVNGFDSFFTDTARHFLAMTQEMCRYNTPGWQGLKKIIGQTTSDIIDSMDDLPAHKFDIFLKQDLSEAEEQEFRLDVREALGANQITFTDYLLLKTIKNLKQAIPLFQLRLQKAAEAAAKAAQGQLEQAAIGIQVDAETKRYIADKQFEGVALKAQSDAQSRLHETQMKEQGKFVNTQTTHQNRLVEADQKKNHDKELIQQEAVADLVSGKTTQP